MRRSRRVLAVGLLAGVVVATSLPGAQANIAGENNAAVLAAAILETPDALVQGVAAGGAGSLGIGDSALGGFPTHGSTYIVLSTGQVGSASLPNGAEDMSYNYGTQASHPDPQPGTDWRPPDQSTVHDLASLEITFTAPDWTTCVQFDAKFLSEELGGEAVFNDGFRALLLDGTGNIAYDPDGYPVEALAAVPAPGRYTADNAVGTTYDGATPTLTFSAPVGPGTHTLRFVVYDAQDGLFDSTVFIDRLSFGPNCYAPLETVLAGPAAPAIASDTAYSLTVTNPTSVGVPFDLAELTLPEGVEYVDGSTTGATSEEPIMAGDTLTWTPGGLIAPGAAVTLGFSLRAMQAIDTVLHMTSAAGFNEGAAELSMTVTRNPSALTMDVTKTRRKIKASGLLFPARPDSPVTVQLLRKKGGVFGLVATRTVNLGPGSSYTASFPRPATGKCQTVARFDGNTLDEPSTVRRRFSC